MKAVIPPHTALLDAIRQAGGQSRFARLVGCTPGNISQLVRKGAQLSDRFVLKAEAGTGVSRHDLRPDLYPREEAAPLPALPPITSTDEAAR